LGYTGFFSYTERQMLSWSVFDAGSPPVVLTSPFVEVFSISLHMNW
jgi:hypothetical protein